MGRPLDDVVIADFTQMLQGPFAVQKLADMGAEVIKIERVEGEWVRRLPLFGEYYRGHDDLSLAFLGLNRNKKSVALDLKADRGREIAERIVASADVVIENFSPGTMERLGLGYEAIRETNPEIVYVSASGYGPDGPYAEAPGQDLLIQSMSGLASVTGQWDDPPTPTGAAVFDVYSASLAAFYTVVALYERKRTGEGQKIDISLMNSAADLQVQELTASLNSDQPLERSETGIASPRHGAPYGIYRAADGYVAIAMSPLERLNEVLDVTLDLSAYDSAEAAYRHRDEIKVAIEERTNEIPVDQLVDSLRDAGVWAGPVYDHEEFLLHPQVEHNELIQRIDHPREGTFETVGIPVTMSNLVEETFEAPPTVGEHTWEILRDLDYSPTEIERLRVDGVLAAPD